MPSIALRARRRPKQAGRSRNRARRSGNAQSRAPSATDTAHAASVTAFAVTPTRNRLRASGRSSAWKRGLSQWVEILKKIDIFDTPSHLVDDVLEHRSE